MIAENPQTYSEMVEADRSATLDDILSRYHHWSKNYRTSRGFKSKAPVIGDYQVSRQYDDCNGALDDDLEVATMVKVDFHITEMAEPYRTAMYCQARALNLGLAVFMSPRLPEDKAERGGVVAKARVILIGRLVGAGVM